MATSSIVNRGSLEAVSDHGRYTRVMTSGNDAYESAMNSSQLIPSIGPVPRFVISSA